MIPNRSKATSADQNRANQNGANQNGADQERADRNRTEQSSADRNTAGRNKAGSRARGHRSPAVRPRSATHRALWTAGALAAGVALSACAPPAPGDSTVRSAQASLPGESDSPDTSTSTGTSTPSTSNPSPGTTGTSAPSTTTEPSTTAPGSTHPRPAPLDRCHTGQLSASLQNSDAGAGQRYADLVLRNRSEQPCTVYGYGGMQLVDASGHQVPTDLERVPNPGPALVHLDPGGTAVSSLRWTVVSSGGEPTTGQCQPTAASARVTPPDETVPLTTPWNFGPVCNHGHIGGSAYH